MIAKYLSRVAKPILLAGALFTIAPIAARGAAFTASTEGQSRDTTVPGNGSLAAGFGIGVGTAGWSGSAAQNWRELDWIPLRVNMVNTGPLTAQTITINVDRSTVSGTPGFQGLYTYTSSTCPGVCPDPPHPQIGFNDLPGQQIDGNPLHGFFTPTGGVNILSTTFSGTATTLTYTVQLTCPTTGATPTSIKFLGRLAAGAHAFPGSSLQLKGTGGTFDVFKPGAAPGNPDLAITKLANNSHATSNVAPCGTITYTLNYSNQTGSSGTGVQVDDTVPTNATYDSSVIPTCAGTCPTILDIGDPVLGHLIWDVGTLAPGASGTLTFQMKVTTGINTGHVDNTVTIRSAEIESDAANDTNSTSAVSNTVSVTATHLAVTDASGTPLTSLTPVTGIYGGTVSLSAKLTQDLCATSTAVSGQTITFQLFDGTNPPVTVGTAPTNASGIATLTPASLSGLNVGFYATGVQAIYAGQPAPAAPIYSGTSASADLTITKRPASVSAVANFKTYGDVDPVLTTTHSVVPVVDDDTGFLAADLGPTKITFSASRAPGESVTGSPYLITPAATDNSIGQDLLNNYGPVTINTANFTINAATLTVTADANAVTAAVDAFTKPYSAANPTFTVRYAGFVNGEDATNLGGTLGFTTAATAASGVGDYDVTPNGLTSTNYAINFVKGTLTIGQATLTVTADANPATAAVDAFTKSYGAANPTFTVQYVGFVNGDNATSLGGTLGFTTAATAASGVGDYDVTPNGLTSTNYAIDFVKGTLTIGQATLTVTADSDPVTAAVDVFTKSYGAANPTFTVRYVGFMNGDNATSLGGTLGFTTAATAGSAVGDYDVTPNGLTSSNYAIDFLKGTLTIGQATLTVTADANPATAAVDPFTKNYGAANPAFTVRYAGFVNGEDATNLGGTPGFTTAATASSAVGDYDVTPGGLTSTNYAIDFVKGTLSIGQATLTVTADANPATAAVDAFTKSYGAANPAFTARYSGFVNGEDATNLGGTLGFTTAATVASGVGDYDVTPNGLTSTNYAITFGKGTLTVDKVTATVSAVAKSKIYGATDPALTTTNSGFLAGDLGVAKITFSASRAAGETVAGGPYTITPAAGDNATGLLGNYTVKLNTADFTISKKGASVTPTANSKTYGASDPALSGTKTGFLSADHVIATYSRTAGETVAGSPYTITAVLSPAAILTNYDITQNSAEFTIAKATLHTGPGGTIVINHYDVTYNGAPHTATGSVKGVKGEDLTNLLTLSGSTHTIIGNYATDPWTFAGNANYNSANGIVTPADKIRGKTITVTAAAVDKVYDGTKSANVTLSTNKIGSDKVTASFTGATFADKHVGAAKPVNATGISISGADASNYTLGNTTASTTASITAKPITVTAVPDTKLYDGTTTSTGIPKVSPPAVAGDTANFIQTFDSRVVGGKRKLTPSGSVTDGNTGKNYAVTFVPITVPGGGVITVRTVTGGITAASKTYDRTTSATIAGRTLTGPVSGDAVTLSGGTATFADPNAGAGKTVTATGLSLSGADADNYDLSSTTATAKADITKANQVINFAPIENKIFNVDGPFKIDATASSGLPVTFTLTSGPAKLDGTEVTITGVGKITVTAMQAGDSNYNPAETVQKFFAAVPPPALLNISTRGRVGTQDNVLIGGYIVRGVEEKKFAARAIGPSLKTTNTPQVVVDPLLELHGPDGALLAKNDNFAETQVAEIEAAQLTPTNALESVLIRGAMPGNYTAIVKDKREANGIGLVELYDLSQNSNSSLANLSTRGVVGAGPDVLIGGFIVNGKVGAAKVILRAIGPSLAEAGIANTLPNPTMELRDHNGALLGSNNDWQDDPSKAALIQATGIPPKNALESALLTSLPPGNYTVIIADKDGKTGVGLVEIYDVTY